MTTEETKKILSENREMVISFFNDKVKVDRFYNLKWFMTRVLIEASLSWQRRKNIGMKDIERALNNVIKNHPSIQKGYVSNYQKAVRYFGAELANNIANSK